MGEMKSEKEIRALLKVDVNHRDSLLNSSVNEKKHIKMLNKRINLLKWILGDK